METKTLSFNAEPKEPSNSAEGSKDSRRKILLQAFTLWDQIFSGKENRDLELLLVAYTRVLATVPVERLAYACDKVLERARFFPMPSEILELAGEPTIKGLELEAQRAWQALLHDFDIWSNYRDEHGRPIPGKHLTRAKRPDQQCALCDGSGWEVFEAENQVRRARPCPCTGPNYEQAPQLDSATIFALKQAGGYRAVREGAHGERGGWLQKNFVEAWLYHKKTSSLEHPPAAKTDVELLDEIEKQFGVRVLKS